MKVIDHIKKAKKTLFSLEIIPPVKGKNIKELYDALDPLMEFKPPFIDVTYHREEYVYKTRENGLLERIMRRKRPGTVGICASIMNRYKVDAVPHLICGGFNKEETENALLDLHYLGIENVLVLRGDARSTDKGFVPEFGGHHYASDLLGQVMALNRGEYLDEDIHNEGKTNFSVGVAGYPEKHFEAPNLETDLKFLKQKVDLGAEFIVTQMFFDNSKYFAFVEKCRQAGIKVPIIPGLKPITHMNQVHTLPKTFHIDIPNELIKTLTACKTNQEAIDAGVEWCIAQSKELMHAGVPCLHYYTMGRSEAIYRIGKALF